MKFLNAWRLKNKYIKGEPLPKIITLNMTNITVIVEKIEEGTYPQKTPIRDTLESARGIIKAMGGTSRPGIIH